MTERAIIWLAFGFLAGVFIASFISLGTSLVFTTALLSGALFFVSQRRHAPRVFLLASMFLGVSMGLFHTYMSFYTPNTYDALVGSPVVLEGIIVDDPERRPTTTHVVVRTDHAPDEYVLLYGDRFHDVVYGDRVRVEGVLEYPHAFSDNTGTRIFRYPEFLAKDHVRYVMHRPAITVLVSDEYTDLFSFLFSIKHRFTDAVHLMLVEPKASLASGITVGERQALTEYWKEVFIRTGLIHIVVLSGFNITLIVGAVLAILHALTARRRVHFFVGVLIIMLFVLMTGASPTGVRAGIMASIAMLAVYTHRDFDALRALFFAAVCMVAWNPYVLVFDPGFQLSVIATFGLVYASPVFHVLFHRVPEAGALREIVASTFATYLFVLPYLLFMSGTWSFIALPINILVLPFIPLAMSLVFGGALFSMLIPALAPWFGAPAYAILSYVLWIAEQSASLSYAAYTMPAFSFWIVLCMYLLLVMLTMHARTVLLPQTN